MPRWACRHLAFDRIAAFARVILDGCDFELQLLCDHAAEKAAHGMRLPAGGLDQFLEPPGLFSSARILSVLVAPRPPVLGRTVLVDFRDAGFVVFLARPALLRVVAFGGATVAVCARRPRLGTPSVPGFR